MFRYAYQHGAIGLAIAFSLWAGAGLQAYGQSSDNAVTDGLAKLDRAICLQQWQQAIDIISGLIASSNVSSNYRQELLNFRRQLQAWQISSMPPNVQSICDRTLPLVLTLAEPETPPPKPLDWNRALAMLANPRPIIQLDDNFEPTDNLIPPELLTSSPEVLAAFATPIDTLDGFSVVGNSINRRQQVYSFLARMGDRVSLEVDVTRVHMSGNPQLLVFDQSGGLLAESEPTGLQTSIQNLVMPKTDVYFVAVNPQGSTPVLDIQGQIVDWQTSGNTSFDYTLTLTGVTPYQALMP